MALITTVREGSLAIRLPGAVPEGRDVLGACGCSTARTLFATRSFGKRLGIDPDTAPAIHVGDTVSAVRARTGGQLPTKAAWTVAVFSSVNVLLSLLAWSPPQRRRRRLPWRR